MLTIYKYYLEVDDDQVVEIPKYGKILCVQTQHEKPCIWVQIDTNNIVEDRYFKTFGTGAMMPDNIDDVFKYIGTYQLKDGVMACHVYEAM